MMMIVCGLLKERTIVNRLQELEDCQTCSAAVSLVKDFVVCLRVAESFFANATLSTVPLVVASELATI